MSEHEALMAVLDAAIDLLVANGPCDGAEYDGDAYCASDDCEYCRLGCAVERASKVIADE